MPIGWFNHLAGDGAIGWSSGSEPVSGNNPGVFAAMAEVRIDVSREFSKPWTGESILAVDVVIAMGCGDACSLLPGEHNEDWRLDDPAGESSSKVRTDKATVGRASTSGNCAHLHELHHLRGHVRDPVHDHR